jgi:hypothetical protein
MNPLFKKIYRNVLGKIEDHFMPIIPKNYVTIYECVKVPVMDVNWHNKHKIRMKILKPFYTNALQQYKENI